MDISLNIPSTSLRYGRRFIITSRFCLSFSPSFRLGVNQNIDPSLRYGRHLIKRVAPSRFSLPTTSRRWPFSRRRFATLRSGRHLRRSHPFLSSHWTVTLIVTRRYLKDKFSSSPYSCFVSRFLLRFCFVLRRSLSSSSSQLNNPSPHSSAQTRPS